MSFKLNDHSRDYPDDAHAIMSPSLQYWSNYDRDKFYNYICSTYAQTIGTLLHELAADLIETKIKVTKNEARKMILLKLLKNKVPRSIIDVERYVTNFVTYVNDAIGFDMIPEVKVKFSENAFGRIDAFRFNEKKMHLRIHDYKSGVLKPCLRQLELYAAYFCLEYHIKPKDITIELRIYWQDEVIVGLPTAADIVPLIDRVLEDDKFITSLKEG